MLLKKRCDFRSKLVDKPQQGRQRPELAGLRHVEDRLWAGLPWGAEDRSGGRLPEARTRGPLPRPPPLRCGRLPWARAGPRHDRPGSQCGADCPRGASMRWCRRSPAAGGGQTKCFSLRKRPVRLARGVTNLSSFSAVATPRTDACGPLACKGYPRTRGRRLCRTGSGRLRS